mgnify:CR=1 FL=1
MGQIRYNKILVYLTHPHVDAWNFKPEHKALLQSHFPETAVQVCVNSKEFKDKLPVAGKVAWITPKGAQGNKIAGIGVQFSELDKGATKSKIENQLAGALKSDRPTHTM